MSDSETLILVIGMFVIVIAIVLVIYRFFLQRGASKAPLPSREPQKPSGAVTPGPAAADTRAAKKSAVQAAADSLAAEVQAGYVRIVATTKCLQDQIQLLYSIRHSIDPAHPLEREKAEKFEQNTQNLDRMADRYIVLYHELRVLMKNENLIRAPESLLSYRKKEFEKLQQLLSLSKEIQPLLNENEDIVAPFIGYPR